MALKPDQAIDITDADRAAADNAERVIDTKLASRRDRTVIVAIGVLAYPVLCELERRYVAAGWSVQIVDGGAAAPSEIRLTTA